MSDRPSIAQRIVDKCEHDPSDNVDPHPRLFDDLDNDRVSNLLFTLWQKGVVDAEWDEDGEGTDWRLSHFGVELNERGLVRPYIEATENELEINADVGALVNPEEFR